MVVIPDHFQSGSRPTRPNSQPKETINNIKFDFEKPERILSEFLEENGINYLLLRPGFNKYISDTGRGLVIPNDGHWNADGHALASQLIYKKLKDDELVPIKGKGDH